MNELNAIFVRGLPGSGKSTYARSNYPDRILIEADQFFIKDGQYQFDKSKISEAHLWAQEKMAKEIEKGNPVIVCNTFSRQWELQTYLDKLPEGSSYEVITLLSQFQSIHDVPEDVVELMRSCWEHWEGEKHLWC